LHDDWNQANILASDYKSHPGCAASFTNHGLLRKIIQGFEGYNRAYDQPRQRESPDTTWTSSDPSIASISSEGLASGVRPGVTTISADCQCYIKHTNLTISNSAATLSSIAVTPADSALQAGATQQFTATGTYSNGNTSVVTTSATWTSSSNTIATVSSAGLSGGVSTGKVTITATANDVSGDTTLTVQ
jgi:uncharacterized protein YjdB